MADIIAAKSFLVQSRRKKIGDALLPGEATTSFRRYNKGSFATDSTPAIVCDKSFLRALITRLNRCVTRLPLSLKWTPNQYVHSVRKQPGDENRQPGDGLPMIPMRLAKTLRDVQEEIKRLIEHEELFPSQKVAERFFKETIPNFVKVVQLADGLEKLANQQKVPGLNAPKVEKRWDQVLHAAKIKPWKQEKKWVELKVTRRRPLYSCTICFGETYAMHYPAEWWDGVKRGAKNGGVTSHPVLTSDGKRRHDNCKKCRDANIETRLFAVQKAESCYWCRKSGLKYYPFPLLGRPEPVRAKRKKEMFAKWKRWFRNSSRKSKRSECLIKQRIPPPAAMILRRLRAQYDHYRRRYRFGLPEFQASMRPKRKDPFLMANATGENYFSLLQLPNHMVNCNIPYNVSDLRAAKIIPGPAQPVEALAKAIRCFQGRLLPAESNHFQYIQIRRHPRYIRERTAKMLAAHK